MKLNKNFIYFLPPGLNFSLISNEIFPWLVINNWLKDKFNITYVCIYLLTLIYGFFLALWWGRSDHLIGSLITFSYPLIALIIIHGMNENAIRFIDSKIKYLLFLWIGVAFIQHFNITQTSECW